MERMRAIVITIFLFVSVVIAETAEYAGTDETAEYAGTDETANNLGKDVGMSLAINEILNGQPKAYESPRFKRFVTHCSSHVAETCSGNDPMNDGTRINDPNKLSLCLFDSMEACLVDHKALLYQTSSSDKSGKSIQYLPVLIQTVKFQTVLRTCSHVTAQTCLSTSNVDSSALSACLRPSLNTCVYLDYHVPRPRSQPLSPINPPPLLLPEEQPAHARSRQIESTVARSRQIEPTAATLDQNDPPPTPGVARSRQIEPTDGKETAETTSDGS